MALGGNYLVEFSEGYVEVLPMPTYPHQLIALFLRDSLKAVSRAHKLGSTIVAPMRLRLWPRKFREPDVMFLLAKNANRKGVKFWDGCDLAMEVVSDDDRRRDLEVKREEYAHARISEDWIVDPRDQRITVLRLDGDAYVVHGEFGPGQRATSALLPQFNVDVNEVFDAPNRTED